MTNESILKNPIDKYSFNNLNIDIIVILSRKNFENEKYVVMIPICDRREINMQGKDQKQSPKGKTL